MAANGALEKPSFLPREVPVFKMAWDVRVENTGTTSTRVVSS